jgi:hypothetical protein
MMDQAARDLQSAKMKLRWKTDKKYRKMMKRRNKNRGSVLELPPEPFPPGVHGVCDMFLPNWDPGETIPYEEPAPGPSWMDELSDAMTSKDNE